ncbi:MAG TPA: hypothetical protein VH349_11230 [Ktedonobacterales bacterium]
MSNRGGSRNRGSGSWREDDDWGDDRYAPPPPRRQSSSRGSAQGAARAPRPRYDDEDDYRAPSSRSRRPSAWEDDDRWGENAGGGWNDRGGPTDWNDPRYAGERRGGIASGLSGMGAYRGIGRAESGEKKGSFPIRGLVVALVVVAILGGLGYGAYTLLRSQGSAARPTAIVPDAAFATYTPGPTPTPATNFKEFASARAKYVLSYPNTWAVSSNEAKLQQQYDYTDVFNPPNSPSHVSVEQAGVFSYYTEQKIIQGEVAGAQQSGFTFTEVTTAQAKQTVGGATWQRSEYDINANGQPLHMAILATHHGGKGYVIVLVSTAAEFGNDAQSVFDPLLTSFRFTA